MLKQEQYISQRHKEVSDEFARTHGRAFGLTGSSPKIGHSGIYKEVLNDNLKSSQDLGFYKTGYLKNHITQFSDPAFATIKPQYSPSKPSPFDDQIKAK